MSASSQGAVLFWVRTGGPRNTLKYAKKLRRRIIRRYAVTPTRRYVSPSTPRPINSTPTAVTRHAAPERMIRRATLACSAREAHCQLVLIPADEAKAQ